MKESETLFYLVRSLSKNEKRNFRLAAKRGKEKGYLALYDWYERQKAPANPGAAELLQLGLTPNRLAVQKHYLLHRILDSLMAHSTGLSEEAKVRLLLNKSELLLAKGMSTASLRLLDVADRIAMASFSYQLQLDIMLRREAHVVKYEDVQLVAQLSTKKKRLLQIIGNIDEYQQLSYQVFAFTRRDELLRLPARRKALERICANAFLQNEKKALSPIAKFQQYHTLCHAASLLQDPLRSLEYGHRHLAIFDEEEAATRYELDYYVTLLFNISVVTIYFGDAAQIAHVMQRWEEFPKRFAKNMTPQRERKWKFYSMEMELRHLFFAGRFDELVRLLPRITQLLKTPHPYTPVFRESSSFYIALALHAVGNSRQALRWLTPVITDEKVEYRRYRLLLKVFGLRLLIHYDLGRPDVTETLCGQLENFLHRQSHPAGDEPVMPATFTRLLQTPPGKARRELLRKAAQHISDTHCRPGKWFDAYEHIAFYAWFRAGETQRGLRETMPEALEEFRRKARASFQRKK